MLNKWKENKWLKLLLITGAVYFFLKYLTGILAPILFAVLFVIIFGPLLKTLKVRLKINRQIGALLLLLIGLVVIAVLLWVLLSWVLGSIPGVIKQIEIWEVNIQNTVNGISTFLANTIRIDSSYLEEILVGWIEDGIDYFQMTLLPGLFADSLVYFKKAAAFGGFLLTFVIATVLLAKDYDYIMNVMLEREEYHVILEVICGIVRYIATFIKAQLFIMVSIGTVAALGLGIAGISNGILWGIAAGILDALPFIGTGIVLLPLALLQLINGYYGKGIVCILLYALCILLREILEPKLIGKKMGISPIMVLIAIYSGIQLFGIAGIIKGPFGFVLIYEIYRNCLSKRELI